MRGNQWNQHYSRKYPRLPACEMCGCRGPRSQCWTTEGSIARCNHALQWDHCHKHNVVRGTLCTKCNTRLELFESDKRSFWPGYQPRNSAQYQIWQSRCPGCDAEQRYTLKVLIDRCTIPMSYRRLLKAKGLDPGFPAGVRSRYTAVEVREWYASPCIDR